MIIVKIMGGLGNQMFQFAVAKKFATLDNEVKLDLSYFDQDDARPNQVDLLGSTLPIATEQEIRELKDNSETFIRDTHYYMPEIFTRKNAFINGYWQTEKYFKDIRQEICNNFLTCNIELSEKNAEFLKDIQSKKNVVSIHFRGGDYLEEVHVERFGNICTKEYYRESIEYLQRELGECYFVIFTNDVAWVNANFELPNSVLVDWNTGENDYLDMYLMSKCNHNILANSSFSWWGAWLNRNQEKIVISPKKWFNIIDTPDIWCDEWIRF